MLKETIYVVTGMAILIGTCSACRADRLLVDDVDFDQMSQADRLGLLIAALEWREEKLENFEYTLHHQTIAIDLSAGMRHVIIGGQYELSRDRAHFVLKCNGYSINGKHVSDFAVSWDGREGRRLSMRANGRKEGTVTDTEHSTFRELPYNRLLGWRVLEGPYTLPEWIRMNRSTPGAVMNVDRIVDERRRSLIELHLLKNATLNFWFRFDPGRDFLMVELRAEHRVGEKVGNWERHEATEVTKSSDLWVPMRVVGRSGIGSEPTRETEYVHEVSSFRRDVGQAKELEVQFPEGTVVVDMVARRSYRIAQGGRQVEVPVYDPQTGRVTGERPAISRGMAKGAEPDIAGEKERASGRAQVAVADKLLSGWRAIVLVTFGASVLLLGLWLLAARFRTLSGVGKVRGDRA